MAVVEATFGFIDLAGFTALTEVHGDEEAVALLGRFEALASDALARGDRLVKTIGDAVMIACADPRAAINATRRLLATCMTEPGMPMPRAGLHHGEAIERDDDFFGATVNLAARVAGQAHGAQVLATEAVAAVARIEGVHVVDLGSFSLRNLASPIELFELGLCPSAAGVAIDPVCRMQVPRSDAAGRLRHEEADYWFCSLRCAGLFAGQPSTYVSPAVT